MNLSLATSSSIPQNLVDNVRLSRCVEMKNLLMNDIYVLGKQYVQGMDVCPQACLSDSRQASIHCSNWIPYPHWCRVNIGGSGG